MDKICMHFDCGNRNYSGYCKTTVCINPKYSNIGTAQYGQGVQNRIITNADRIRTMTDEELAEYMSIYCCSHKTHDSRCQQFKDCGLCWFDWLRQEVNA